VGQAKVMLAMSHRLGIFVMGLISDKSGTLMSCINDDRGEVVMIELVMIEANYDRAS
jgi:hypothetical protein